MTFCRPSTLPSVQSMWLHNAKVERERARLARIQIGYFEARKAQYPEWATRGIADCNVAAELSDISADRYEKRAAEEQF